MVRPRQISTEKIIEAAKEAFLERGLGVSMQVIADKVGLSQPALFKRFKTKKDLVFAALAPPEKLPVVDWIESGPSKGDLRPQLEELLTKLWETIGWILPRLMVLRTGKFSPEQFLKKYKTPPLVLMLQALSRWFERAAENGQLRSDGDPSSWAQSCLGALQGRALLRNILKAEFGPEDDEDYIGSLTDLLLDGMKSEAENV